MSDTAALGARLLTGRPVADAIKADVTARAASLQTRGVTPTLGLIRVGDRADDLAYQGSVMRQADRLGIAISLTELPETASQNDIEAALAGLNDDASVHGIMIFQPLPEGLDAKALNRLIDPVKDVDGLSPTNQALVYAGDAAGVPPCTAQAVVRMLQHYQVPLHGARVAMVGRSMVVGKPAAMLLLDAQATVTVCHSRTRDLPEATRLADVVVAALGKPRFLGAEYFRPGQTVIDVGIHVDDSGALVGDVDAEAVTPVVDALTPARGGLGAVTSALLFEHLVAAAERLTDKE